MGPSQRTRLLVFSIFFVLLVIFAALYRPVDAISRPASQTGAATTPAGFSPSR